MTLEGIDVSQWNAATPPLVGQSFAFARATYGAGIDSLYAMHAANFRKAGIVSGAYAFGVNADGAAQARVFLTVAHGADLLALDLEVEPGKTPMTSAQAQAFIRTVKAAGYKCGLYHQDSGFPDVGQDWDWVARWTTLPPSRPWLFWQWQGTGIDRDRFAGSLADLHKLAGTAGGDVVAVTDPSPKFLDLAKDVQLYATDGKTKLTTMSAAAAGLYSPFGNGMQRAVVITTGGVTQVAMVATAICTNVRPYSVTTVSAWTVNGKPISSGSITY